MLDRALSHARNDFSSPHPLCLPSHVRFGFRV